MYLKATLLLLLAHCSVVTSIADTREVITLNWFHLQHCNEQWKGHMQAMTKQLNILAHRAVEAYQWSYMGLATFTDKSNPDEYTVVTRLTTRGVFLEKLYQAFPPTWGLEPSKTYPSWPDDDSEIADSVYTDREGMLNDQPEGVQEPIIWAALHMNWDKSGVRFYKLITVAVAGLPHFNGDGSGEDQRYGGMRSFGRDTYPSNDKSFWPSQSQAPYLAKASQYAEPSLTKEVLRETDANLIVLYAIDGNQETPRKGWQSLLTNLGADYRTTLHFIPQKNNAAEFIMNYLIPATDRSTTTTTTTPAAPISPDTVKINWFHLQHQSDGWMGHMQELTKQLTALANRMDSAYPGSKMGSAWFADKNVEEYRLITKLTDKRSAMEKLLERYPATWKPDFSEGHGPWPSSDTGLPDAVYAQREGKFENEPEGALEPIIYTSLHANWDSEGSVLRLITEATLGLPHYDEDGSAEALLTLTRRPFYRDTYPTNEKSYWPPSPNPPSRGYWSRYADIEFTKQILLETNVHILILYGIDGNGETPREGWKKLLTNLGVDPTKTLHYMTQSIDAADIVMDYLYPTAGKTTTSTTTTTTTTTTPTTTTTTTPTTTTTTTPTTTTTTTPTTTPTTTTPPTTPTTTTPTTTPTTTTPTTTPTTTTPTTTSATTPTTTPTATTPTTTVPTLTYQGKSTSTAGSVTISHSDSAADADDDCGIGCWKHRGIVLMIDEKPKRLDIKVVA